MSALLLALATMAFYEIVDFSLHIPANALLFTVLLAIAARIALGANPGGAAAAIQAHRGPLWVAAGMIAAGGTLLIVFALTQAGFAYPYDISKPISSAQARTLVLEHPVSARAHMALFELAESNWTPRMRLRELNTASGLDPTNPTIRDLYAETLALTGKEKESLDEFAESVFNSPAVGTHTYLDKRLVPWLSTDQQNAVERGYMKAAAADYPGAISNLGAFFDALEDFPDEMRLFDQTASSTRSASDKTRYLAAAGEAAVRGGADQIAQGFFRRAIAASPSEPEPYVNLVVQIYGPSKDLRAAQAATQEGIRNGADPLLLYQALAAAAQMNGNEGVARAAMLKALGYDPSFRMIMRLAQFYLQNDEFGRAASMLQNATEINPASADAFYLLGIAEERDYQYSDADKAYARAAKLAPQQFRPRYSAFRERMESSRSAG
jgi:tetratricopeptide (TPR) repeat protein